MEVGIKLRKRFEIEGRGVGLKGAIGFSGRGICGAEGRSLREF